MRITTATAALALALSGAAAAADNIPYNQAAKAGVDRCLPAVSKVTEFLIADGNAGAHSIWNSEHPGTSAFSTAIERNYSDGATLANLVVAPTADGKCYAEYVRIYNSDKSCIATVGDFEGAKIKGEINREIALVEHGAVSMYLLPNGTNNCTVVRKEVLMDM